MNRWHVYELLKRHHYNGHEIPDISSIAKVFNELDTHEIMEGVAEFEEAFGVKVQHEEAGRMDHVS